MPTYQLNSDLDQIKEAGVARLTLRTDGLEKYAQVPYLVTVNDSGKTLLASAYLESVLGGINANESGSLAPDQLSFFGFLDVGSDGVAILEVLAEKDPLLTGQRVDISVSVETESVSISLVDSSPVYELSVNNTEISEGSQASILLRTENLEKYSRVPYEVVLNDYAESNSRDPSNTLISQFVDRTLGGFDADELGTFSDDGSSVTGFLNIGTDGAAILNIYTTSESLAPGEYAQLSVEVANQNVLLRISDKENPLDPIEESGNQSYTPLHSKLLALFESLNSPIVGTNSSEELIGTAGNDFIQGGQGSDTLRGGSGSDALFGYLEYEDSDTSPEEVSRLTEGDGDVLYGGPGDDLFLSDSWTHSSPVFIELPNEGTDSVFGVPYNGYTLEDNIENILNDTTITNNGTPVFMEVRGNDLNNYISTASWDKGSYEHFIGGRGNDTLLGGGGDDRLDGGAGVDTAIYRLSPSEYSISRSASDIMTIAFIGPVIEIYPPPVTEGTDELISIERIAFSDSTIAFDFQAGESGYKSAMLISAAFGKDFVPAYFSAGLSLFDLGRDTAYVCDLIVGAGLIEAQISDASNKSWVKHVYKNVVGVDPDPLTELVLIDFLASGQFTRSSLLATAAELTLLEAQVDITGLQTTGLTYTPFI